MQYEGVLNKMHTELANPIQYYLVFDQAFIHINQIIYKDIEIQHVGYQCLNCKKEKKIFRQGFCYDCFMKSAAAGDWIMRPELSTAHLDIEDRDLEYEKKVQLQPHIVYLAVASDVKIGVTRKTQVPTRWIDQGASAAIPVVEVPNRYLAGITEVALKKHYTDKTNWRKMVLNQIVSVDLDQEVKKIEALLPEEVHAYFRNTAHTVYELAYPVEQYLTSCTSLNIDKTPNFKGKLIGVKGQYLMFEDGTVFNLRSYEGYKVILNIE
ncbi:DUF2797 domain-containing protein [Flavobacterium sp. CBA20B-1]|uniref:DUF2797 domain-containing protein n=1 Tax=unclassified Flavobacterium TaxID=196869 RepID=UPI002224F948|nr:MULTISPECIES: DUF2797 domain-containing protein [unclassified Flavobacterium]WCM42975.1 DUF2797 domain-containing protein [Flavobacterium sp. CBA20B-1]